MRVLVSGADAKDLGEVVDVLKSNQVPFEYSESGDTILYPKKESCHEDGTRNERTTEKW